MTVPRQWPLFDLVVRTPRLELRYATDDLLEELAPLTADVVAPDTLPFDGDATFYDLSSAGPRRWLTGHWGARAKTSPEWWVLVFAVVVDGRAVGGQEMTADGFPTLRTVGTFSWLSRRHQDSGLGKEMRHAILHLAFEGLGAQRATSEAFVDNIASCRVSEALGYADNGTVWGRRKQEAAPMRRFELTRETWQQRRRDDMVIKGLDACLEGLGLDDKTIGS